MEWDKPNKDMKPEEFDDFNSIKERNSKCKLHDDPKAHSPSKSGDKASRTGTGVTPNTERLDSETVNRKNRQKECCVNFKHSKLVRMFTNDPKDGFASKVLCNLIITDILAFPFYFPLGLLCLQARKSIDLSSGANFGMLLALSVLASLLIEILFLSFLVKKLKQVTPAIISLTIFFAVFNLGMFGSALYFCGRLDSSTSSVSPLLLSLGSWAGALVLVFGVYDFLLVPCFLSMAQKLKNDVEELNQ